MIRSLVGTAVVSALLCAAAGSAMAQTFTQAANGKRLFDGLCQDCHGVNGTGDEAPALNHALGADDAALHRLIRDGDLSRGMPRVRRMTEEEAAALVLHVRTLGRGGAVTVAGNADRGRAIYARLDCTTCHAINGQGGVFGPELSKIGQRRAPSYLREALLDPGKARPVGMQGILLNGFNEYLPVSVVSRDGRETRGIRVNEDSFTIQMRDAAGKLYSFRKSEVTNVDKQFGRSLMPNYKDRLSTAETDDLVAYLFTLGSAK